MFIQTETTPNPATLKFLPGRAVLKAGTRDINDAREAAAVSPLAARLFEIDGVTGVFLGSNFVSVTKRDGEWQHSEARRAGRDHGAFSFRRAGAVRGQ